MSFWIRSGIPHFAEYQTPAFLVNGQWISARGKASVEKASGKSVVLSLPATNGQHVKLTVEKAGDYGFKLKCAVPDARCDRDQRR